MNKDENAKKMREYYQKLEDERNEWERKEKKLDRLEQEEEYRLAQSKRYIENAKEACGSKDFGIMQLLEEQESNLQSLSKKLGEFREFFKEEMCKSMDEISKKQRNVQQELHNL